MRWADELPRHATGGCAAHFSRERCRRSCASASGSKIPFVARGSGTGLSGGALPVEGGMVISLAGMNRILEVDLPNARVVVEPGVINADVTQRVAPHGYFYAPDPSSQSVCSIGGNVAENSGGAHCLKYGFTTTHVLALEVVLPDGSTGASGQPAVDASGIRSAGHFCGIGRHAGHRDQSRAAHREEAGGRCRLCWRRSTTTERSGRGGQRNHRGGNVACSHRDDGQPRHSGGRSRGARRVSELRRPAAGGTRRPGGGSGAPDRRR